jgi:hypothetical protein
MSSVRDHGQHSQARMVGGRDFLDPQGPAAVEKRENGGPGQLPIVMENLPAPNRLLQRLDGAPQERKCRPRGIQRPKPAAEGGRICYAMGIFHRRRRHLPATALNKIAPQRLTAGDQAVMAVWKRKYRQEGNRLTTRSADTAPNLNPIMVFVMRLFPPTAMTNDRILQANRAPANHPFCASLRPISFQLALRRGK